MLMKISEYEVYWLTTYLLINNWVHTKNNSGNHISFEAACTAYRKGKQTNVKEI